MMIDDYPKPISIEGTKKIVRQMENNICKIYKNDGIKGTGFFCKIKYNNNIIPVMVTNHHVINEEYLKRNKEIHFTLNDDIVENKIIINDNRKIYSNEEYDTTIIEIKPAKDKINDFMEIDDEIFKKSNIFYKNKSIYIIQYLHSDKAQVSYGIIRSINDYNINHFCCTDSGSSGSPIINLENNKIIGIHKQGATRFKFNEGTYLKFPINGFINKYMNKNMYKNIKNKNNNNELNNFNLPLSSSTINNNYEYDQNYYLKGQKEMESSEMVGYRSSFNMENSSAYGTEGLKYIGENPPTNTLSNSEIIKMPEYQTTFNKTLINESTNKPLFSTRTLPTKVLGTKINKTIVDNNIKALPIIYGGNSANSNVVNRYQGQFGQGYNFEGQGNQLYGNTGY